MAEDFTNDFWNCDVLDVPDSEELRLLAAYHDWFFEGDYAHVHFFIVQLVRAQSHFLCSVFLL